MNDIIATRDSFVLVNVGNGIGRVEEPQTGYVGPEVEIGSILAKGYWNILSQDERMRFKEMTRVRILRSSKAQ